jgi:hypothetical protein
LIRDLTPETRFFSIDNDLESELNKLGWNGFFIKDYVKSLKTSVGSIIDRPSAIRTFVCDRDLNASYNLARTAKMGQSNSPREASSQIGRAKNRIYACGEGAADSPRRIRNETSVLDLSKII